MGVIPREVKRFNMEAPAADFLSSRTSSIYHAADDIRKATPTNDVTALEYHQSNDGGVSYITCIIQ